MVSAAHGAEPMFREGSPMKHEARNIITAHAKSIIGDEILSGANLAGTVPTEMATVITTGPVEGLALAVGDEVQIVIKAIHVLPAKE